MIQSVLFLGLILAWEEPVRADRVIEGGLIVDGSGKPGFEGNLAIRGNRIVAVGQFQVAGQPLIINARGKVVAPGFIDLHTHSDSSLMLKPTNANLAYLFQGVTTVVTGNCGTGPVRVADYLRKLNQIGQGTNVIHLIPHNDLRRSVMGNGNRKPTAQELSQMVALTNQGMEEGAWGISTGLVYTPGAYSETDELIALAREVSNRHGIYSSHIRGEGVDGIQALKEALKIGTEAKVPVHISHLKASGKKAWGMANDLIGIIEQARKEGQIVTADQYPYSASSSPLDSLLIPPRFREGDRSAFLRRMEDPVQRLKIRDAMERNLEEMEKGKSVQVSSYRPKPSWVGKDLLTLGLQEKKEAVEVAMEIEENGGAQAIYFSMKEEDVRAIMRQTWVATASDGSSQIVDSESRPHPRSFGCFARKVGRLAIQDELIPLEQATRSCSGLPADILGLKNRGYLKDGMIADVIIFDPTTYRDQATYQVPQRYATGIDSVYINGKLVIDHGKTTGILAGVPLKSGQN